MYSNEPATKSLRLFYHHDHPKRRSDCWRWSWIREPRNDLCVFLTHKHVSTDGTCQRCSSLHIHLDLCKEELFAKLIKWRLLYGNFKGHILAQNSEKILPLREPICYVSGEEIGPWKQCYFWNQSFRTNVWLMAALGCHAWTNSIAIAFTVNGRWPSFSKFITDIYDSFHFPAWKVMQEVNSMLPVVR